MRPRRQQDLKTQGNNEPVLVGGQRVERHAGRISIARNLELYRILIGSCAGARPSGCWLLAVSIATFTDPSIPCERLGLHSRCQRGLGLSALLEYAPVFWARSWAWLRQGQLLTAIQHGSISSYFGLWTGSSRAFVPPSTHLAIGLTPDLRKE
jgi:hypothetical protein